MTIFELFKNANVEQMADLLTELTNGDCGNCFAYEFCSPETTCNQAFLNWLKATAAED